MITRHFSVATILFKVVSWYGNTRPELLQKSFDYSTSELYEETFTSALITQSKLPLIHRLVCE